MKYSKIIFSFLFIFISLNFCFGAIELFGKMESKDHKGFCEIDGILIERGGEKLVEGRCAQYSCLNNYDLELQS